MKVWPRGAFFWQLTKDPRQSNVGVSRRNWDTVALDVSTGGSGTYIGKELTPKQARKVAKALLQGADVVEKYLQEQAEKEKVVTHD